MTGISRRTLAKGAAWTAPIAAVGVAAPTYAASVPCTTRAVASLVDGTTPSHLTFPGSDVTATIGIVATDATNAPVALPGGGDADYDTGEVDGGRLMLVFDEPDDQLGQTITLTLTFSQPVTGLSLLVSDIDRSPTLWVDDVSVLPAGFTATKGANVVGTGPDADPFRSNVNGEISDANVAGHLTVTWAAPVSQVQVRYRPADPVGDSINGQHVGVSQIGFHAC